MDCIFCKIIKNEIPSYTIYEDDVVKVFLDVDPNTNGHLLIIPKEHYVDVLDIDDKVMKHIVKVERDMYKLVVEKLGATGCTFAQNNGIAQEVKHYHMHLMPRYENDGWKNLYDKDKLKPIEEIFDRLKK